MTAFTVRASRPSDHAALGQILAELLGEETLTPALASALNTNLLRLLSTPGNALLVAESERPEQRALLGFVTVWTRWGLFDDAPTALFDRVLVRPGYRDSAVAPALVEQALGAAQALGSTRIEYVPTEDSLVDPEMLGRFGFQAVSEGRYGLDIL